MTMEKSVFAFGVLAACAAFAVQPEVKHGAVNLKGVCTAEEAAAARAKFDAEKGKFPEADIKALEEAMKAANKRARLNAR